MSKQYKDTKLAGVHARSLSDKEGFWGEQAQHIDWFEQPKQVLDFSNPPFARWYVGGSTNLCHNAVDRHLKDRADQKALVYISTETNEEKVYSYAELHQEVQRMAAIMQSLGVKRGDRVLVYMPMIAEAIFAILACARIGAIHSVVFGGFAAPSLAARIDDATPVLMISSDAGMRNGKEVPYKHLVDEACSLAAKPPKHVLLVNRGLAKMDLVAGRDVDYAQARAQHMNAQVPCEKMQATDPSYILYTSGTTGKPKGVQRDTGGYAVALAASMKHIYDCKPGEVFFCTSDIGWVVGHSYIIYGPLINGSTTIVYEGLPLRPDPAIWWSIVEKYQVSTMFSSPTAARVLKKQDPAYMTQHNTKCLRRLFLAGEPLDEPTAKWISEALGGARIIDNYWQTETGWPILSAQHGLEVTETKFGSPSFPVYGYDIRLVHESTFEEVGANEKGMLCAMPPLPPGCLQTVWGDDERFVKTYFSAVPGQHLYSTFDYATRDDDGYYFILGRTDDVINVAGHRLGTREIEEAIQAHKNVAEVAVVGVADTLKGQMPMAFAVLKDASVAATPEGAKAEEKAIMATVDHEIGAIARPSRVHFVTLLPKTRSGKLLRRAMQALAEGRDPGDMTTLEDPSALEQIKKALGA
ncbi:MAG: propionate--CoA ligase [Burkholderiaceae bacterium]